MPISFRHLGKCGNQNDSKHSLHDPYCLTYAYTNRLPPVVEGLANLSPYIREHADTVNFLDINPASRSAVSFNGTVRALPLDTDYISIGWRQDVFHKYNIPEELSPPRSLQDLAKLEE